MDLRAIVWQALSFCYPSLSAPKNVGLLVLPAGVESFVFVTDTDKVATMNNKMWESARYTRQWGIIYILTVNLHHHPAKSKRYFCSLFLSLVRLSQIRGTVLFCKYQEKKKARLAYDNLWHFAYGGVPTKNCMFSLLFRQGREFVGKNRETEKLKKRNNIFLQATLKTWRWQNVSN